VIIGQACKNDDSTTRELLTADDRPSRRVAGAQRVRETNVAILREEGAVVGGRAWLGAMCGWRGHAKDWLGGVLLLVVAVVRVTSSEAGVSSMRSSRSVPGDDCSGLSNDGAASGDTQHVVIAPTQQILPSVVDLWLGVQVRTCKSHIHRMLDIVVIFSFFSAQPL